MDDVTLPGSVVRLLVGVYDAAPGQLTGQQRALIDQHVAGLRDSTPDTARADRLAAMWAFALRRPVA